MTRTDEHRPSEIIPTDYEFAGIEFMREEYAGHLIDIIQADLDKHMKATGADFSDHQHGGSCHICGAHAIYTAVFYHRPSNTYIRRGFDCGGKLGYQDTSVFRSVKAIVNEARKTQKGKKRAMGILGDEGLERAWELFITSDEELDDLRLLYDTKDYEGKPCKQQGKEIRIIKEMVAKLVRYGSISDKQIAYLKTLVDRAGRMKQIMADRAAEKDAAKPCPAGRIDIEGTIIKLDLRDNGYGDGATLKMTVKSDDGWVCWGTVPSILDDGDLNRGDRIKFRATLTVSDNDQKFGFFKRPSGGELIEAGPNRKAVESEESPNLLSHHYS